MSFYELSKGDRAQKVVAIQKDLYKDLTENKSKRIIACFSDPEIIVLPGHSTNF